MDALFEHDGSGLIPTDLARGPWSPDALHGGPTAAIVARAIEQHLAGQEMDWAVTRITLDLLRPVPVEPLVVSARTVRPGRKVMLVEASVAAGAVEVARGAALAERRHPVEWPPLAPSPAPPRPEDVVTLQPPRQDDEWVSFHNSAVEMRWAVGRWGEPGPAVVWIRLTVPVVAGEQPTPLMRAAAAADFGNGISMELDYTQWRFINPDLSLHLARLPVGEWICLDARTVIGTDGAGLAESQLSDGQGVFGRAVQSLLIEPPS
jgi:hypothetical protein